MKADSHRRRRNKPYTPPPMPAWMRQKQQRRTIRSSWEQTLREPFRVRLVTALKLVFGKPLSP